MLLATPPVRRGAVAPHHVAPLDRPAAQEYLRFRCRESQAEQTRNVDILMGAAMLMPREVFTTVGGWDEAFIFGGEDMDFSTRIGRCYEVVYHPEVEVLHHGRTSSRQHPSYAAVHIPAGFVRHLRKTGRLPGHWVPTRWPSRSTHRSRWWENTASGLALAPGPASRAREAVCWPPRDGRIS